jgi:cytochrome c554/c'-like protein
MKGVLQMNRRRMIALAAFAAIVVVPASLGVLLHGRLAYAAGPEPRGDDAKKVTAKYVGPKKCKLCHVAESTGAQYKIWEKSPHAHAFEMLGSDKAKETAKAKGIADPQKAPECLKCHTTAFGEPAEMLNEKIAQEDGVSCEACHGAGELYAKKEVFEKGRAEAVANGLRIPDEKLCKQCHNEQSPQFKGFDFEEYKKKIAHPKPKTDK